MKLKGLVLAFLMGSVPCFPAMDKYWAPANFDSLVIPPDWKEKARRTRVTDYEAVIDWSWSQLERDAFLAGLGLPDRYLRNKKDQRLYMIYDFEGNHTFVVYLSGEKIQSCAAAVLFGPDGKTLKLIK